MVLRHRVEAGRKGAANMWKKRRAKEAAITAKLALWGDITDAVKLLAHPKFTTDERGQIIYYVTRTDVEFARSLLERLTAVSDKGDMNG